MMEPAPFETFAAWEEKGFKERAQRGFGLGGLRERVRVLVKGRVYVRVGEEEDEGEGKGRGLREN